MTGFEIYNKAILRLGYNGSINDRLIERAPELMKQIAEDLKLDCSIGLSEEIKVGDNIAEALCCGLTMLLALSESDGEKHKLYCDIYNAKRAAVLSTSCKVEDKLPVAESGDV